MKKVIYTVIMFSLISCGIRNKVSFYPDKESELPAGEIPEFAAEKWIHTSDNETIQSFLFRHQDDKKYPLIIYFHGNAGNLYYRFPYAGQLYAMNHDVLLVSYRGYAKSSGKPTEKGIYIDAESAITYAIDTLGYDQKDIILLGRSLGTAVAVHNARNKTYNGIILITPMTSGKEMAKAMNMGLFKFIAGKSFNSIDKINDIKSRILIIHGDDDEIVPYYMGKELYETFKGDKKMVTIPGGKHNDLQDVDSAMFWGAIDDFLK